MLFYGKNSISHSFKNIHIANYNNYCVFPYLATERQDHEIVQEFTVFTRRMDGMIMQLLA